MFADLIAFFEFKISSFMDSSDRKNKFQSKIDNHGENC